MWNFLRLIADEVHGSWVLVGDFNAMLSRSDRRGCRGNSYGGCSDFQNFMYDCGLRDMGFKGPRFTWSRGSLLQRLGRALYNLDLDANTHEGLVVHLPKIKSDHRPILVIIGQHQGGNMAGPFRFFPGWLENSDFLISLCVII